MVAYPVETHGPYDQVDKSLGPTEADLLLALLRQTKVSPVQASLGPKSMTALSKV